MHILKLASLFNLTQRDYDKHYYSFIAINQSKTMIFKPFCIIFCKSKLQLIFNLLKMSEKQREELKVENEKLRNDLEEFNKLRSNYEEEIGNMNSTIDKLEQEIKQLKDEKSNVTQNIDIGDCNQKIDQLLSNLKV